MIMMMMMMMSHRIGRLQPLQIPRLVCAQSERYGVRDYHFGFLKLVDGYVLEGRRREGRLRRRASSLRTQRAAEASGRYMVKGALRVGYC